MPSVAVMLVTVPIHLKLKFKFPKARGPGPRPGINKHRLGQGMRPPLVMGIPKRRLTWGPCSTGKRDGTSNTPT